MDAAEETAFTNRHTRLSRMVEAEEADKVFSIQSRELIRSWRKLARTGQSRFLNMSRAGIAIDSSSMLDPTASIFPSLVKKHMRGTRW